MARIEPGMEAMLDMYFYETNTLLEQLDEILLRTEQANCFDSEDIKEIFRIMHTIKGSSAMMFQRENCDILITGDRNIYGEKDLPDLEVLVVGHHGSKYSTSVELLEAGKPDIAIISVGENSYGHPTYEVLDRLTEFGCEVYRTDQQGTITFRR